MSQPSFADQVTTFNAILGAIETRVAEGEVPREVVADFKSSVDDLRLRLWSVLGTGSANDYRAFPSEGGHSDFAPTNDREVALIYAAYADALEQFGLADEDADQLRALQVLRADVDGRRVSLPWLDKIDLLVLDGFFDFTPVQGEILKYLIPAAE